MEGDVVYVVQQSSNSTIQSRTKIDDEIEALVKQIPDNADKA